MSDRELTLLRYHFGKHVKSCRKARGLTQDELAEGSGLAVDTIRRLEQTSFSPSLETLYKLCRGLHINLSTLFIAFELGERDVRRELVDGLEDLPPDEQKMLFQLVAMLRRRSREPS